MSQPHFGQSVSQQGFFTSHDSLSGPCAEVTNTRGNSTFSEMDLTSKRGGKEVHPGSGVGGGKQSAIPNIKHGNTLGAHNQTTWNRSGCGVPAGVASQDNTLTVRSQMQCNGTERLVNIFILFFFVAEFLCA